MFVQRAEQLADRVTGLLGLGRYPRTDQTGELLGGQVQFVILDTEEVADTLQVESRRTALPAQVLVELRAVDRQLAANFGNRAVVTAGKFEVCSEVIAHMRNPGDANDAIVASSRIKSEQSAKL